MNKIILTALTAFVLFGVNMNAKTIKSIDAAPVGVERKVVKTEINGDYTYIEYDVQGETFVDVLREYQGKVYKVRDYMQLPKYIRDSLVPIDLSIGDLFEQAYIQGDYMFVYKQLRPKREQIICFDTPKKVDEASKIIGKKIDERDFQAVYAAASQFSRIRSKNWDENKKQQMREMYIHDGIKGKYDPEKIDELSKEWEKLGYLPVWHSISVEEAERIKRTKQIPDYMLKVRDEQNEKMKRLRSKDVQ